MTNVTGVLTSCRRMDLLEETLKSFAEHNDYPLHELIIIEDSDDERVYEVAAKFPQLPIRVMVNGRNLGHHASIDRAYAEVTTDYILHLEDDWTFPTKGIVKSAISILESQPDVHLVQLRTEREFMHLLEAVPLEVDPTTGTRYRRLLPAFHHVWHSFTFNPTLKRMREYREIEGGYSRFAEEFNISLHYKKQGRVMVWLEGTGIEHIGWGRSNFEKIRRKGVIGFIDRIRRLFRWATLKKWYNLVERKAAHYLRRLR